MRHETDLLGSLIPSTLNVIFKHIFLKLETPKNAIFNYENFIFIHQIIKIYYLSTF